MRPIIASICLLMSIPIGVWAMKATDIPDRAPKDAIMASASEVREVADWAAAAFAGARPKQTNGVILEVRRQDFNTLQLGESCMETPITIGSKTFKHGLGTHANSEIAVTIPAGAKTFEAFVGVDNNYDTQGSRGTARFAVVISGKEVYRSQVLKGGDEPVPVSVTIPPNTKEIVLLVDTTEDGATCDQSDWADARLIMSDGKVRWLDESRPVTLLGGDAPPFSFEYGGARSSDFLKTWKHTSRSKSGADFTEIEATWEDPKTGLAVTATAKAFKDYPAVDWVLSFENRGTKDTPIIENIRAADLTLDTGNSKRAVVLHQLQGDSCGERSFTPFDTSLMLGQSTRIAPTRGRPSQETAFPFWNLQYADKGVITAVGWSGQWEASYDRSQAGPIRFAAGMESTHLLLHPGESIRTPRVLMMTWSGDRIAAHNRFRRLMLFRYVPKLDGRPLKLPIALQTFDRYIGRPGWATEAGQLQAAETASKLGCDTYWFDAGWFVGGFPSGAGNWFCKPDAFPNGLGPVGELCHRRGMQFMVWFEPCRVAPNTQIAREHPDYVLGGAQGGLYNLGNKEARKWITDLISKRITEFGLDCYREDYNIDPLGFWRANDTPDRQGMTEIRFVEGHYAFWDELRARHPGLWIDNCASGGRRIDLETCMRSVPLWRSDTSCSPGHAEWNQAQSAALSQYIPLHTASAWDPERYVFRSSATGGLLCELDYLNPAFSVTKTRTLIKEIDDIRKFWYGDFYPLTPAASALDQFAAFQLHRPDLDAGIVLAFRRPECELRGLVLDPRGLDAKHSYELEFIDEAGKKTRQVMTAKEIRANGLELRIPAKGQSLLVRYSMRSK